jgi:hypothetical protein
LIISTSLQEQRLQLCAQIDGRGGPFPAGARLHRNSVVEEHDALAIGPGPDFAASDVEPVA